MLDYLLIAALVLFIIWVLFDILVILGITLWFGVTLIRDGWRAWRSERRGR
jgi:hypothetical protein